MRFRNEAMEAAGKRYITHNSKSDVFTIYGLGDLHIGSAACAKHEIQKTVQKIKDDPFTFWVGVGDYADFISFRDRKRFDPSTIAPDITIADMGKLGDVLNRQVCEMFRPIADKCLGLCFGNHELKYEVEHEQMDRHVWLCRELGVPNLRYSALMDIVFVRAKGNQPKLLMECKKAACHRTQFRLYAHHGAGSACTPGGKLNRLIGFMNAFDADIYFIGHVHDQKGQRVTMISADETCTRLVSRDKIGVITGSYLKTYAQGITTYGEQRGYAPVPLGAAFVRITPETRQITAEV